MTPTVQVYHPNGTAWFEALVGVGSRRERLLMEKDYITLKFSDTASRILPTGTYVDIHNVGRYELTAPYSPNPNKSTGGYDYEIRLDAQYYKFANKLMRFVPFAQGGETSWSYTDNFAGHAAQIMRNIKALAYTRNNTGTETLRTDGGASFLYRGTTQWEYAASASVDAGKVVTLAYDGTSILDAIAALAEAYDCEWWFEENVLFFGRCQYGTAAALRYGTAGSNETLVTEMRPTASREKYATRIYAYGSDRNIASNYRKLLVFTASTPAAGQICDPDRPLKAAYFPAAVRKSRAQDTATFSGLGGGGSKTVGGSNNEAGWYTVYSRVSTVTNAFDAGTWQLAFNPCTITAKPTAKSNTCDFIRATLTLTVTYADNTTDSFAYSDSQYLHAIDADYSFTFADRTITLDKAATKIMIAVSVDANVGAASSLTATVSMNVAPTLTNPNGPKGAENLTIQILNPITGAASGTPITGAVFNAALTTDGNTITLPSGKSVAAGSKYTISPINNAVVPAAFFTNQYAAFSKYADVVTDGVVNNRLLLPESTGGYIDAANITDANGAVEDVVVFEDIYPSRTSTVVAVTAIEGKYTEEQSEMDGSTTVKRYTAYAIQDDLFNTANPLNDEYLIDGKSLQVTFQDGKLAGLTFDVAWTDDCLFEIQRDDTTKLPNEMFRPEAGDSYILSGFDIAMINDASTDYIAGAEQALLAAAQAYAESVNTDTRTFECTIAADQAKTFNDNTTATVPNTDKPMFDIGRAVTLYNPAYFDATGRSSRVIGYSMPLDIPYDNPVYIVGEKAKYTRLGEIEDKLEAITAIGTYSGAAAGASSGGGVSSEVIAALQQSVESNRQIATEALTRANAANRWQLKPMYRYTSNMAAGKVYYMPLGQGAALLYQKAENGDNSAPTAKAGDHYYDVENGRLAIAIGTSYNGISKPAAAFLTAVGSSSGSSYDDTALRNRITAAETAIAAMPSGVIEARSQLEDMLLGSGLVSGAYYGGNDTNGVYHVRKATSSTALGATDTNPGQLFKVDGGLLVQTGAANTVAECVFVSSYVGEDTSGTEAAPRVEIAVRGFGNHLQVYAASGSIDPATDTLVFYRRTASTTRHRGTGVEPWRVKTHGWSRYDNPSTGTAHARTPAITATLTRHDDGRICTASAVMAAHSYVTNAATNQISLKWSQDYETFTSLRHALRSLMRTDTRTSTSQGVETETTFHFFPNGRHKLAIEEIENDVYHANAPSHQRATWGAALVRNGKVISNIAPFYVRLHGNGIIRI